MPIKFITLINWSLLLTVSLGTIMPVTYGESPTRPLTTSGHSKVEVTYPLNGNPEKTPGVRDFLGTPSTVSQRQTPVLSHPFALSPSPFQPPPRPANWKDQENAWTGKLTAISAITTGLKVAPARLPFLSPNNGLEQLPLNCQGWLLIPEQHQTLVKVALEAFWQEQKITVYYMLPGCLVTRVEWQLKDRQVLPTVRGGPMIRDEDVPAGMRKDKGPFGDRLIPAK